jgi:hypothetical protein
MSDPYTSELDKAKNIFTPKNKESVEEILKTFSTPIQDVRCEYRTTQLPTEEISPENAAYVNFVAKHLADNYMTFICQNYVQSR